MAERSGFWDFIAKRYAKSPVSDEASYQKKLQLTREYFRPDWEVFEFGCGTGSTAIAHAPYVKHIHAVDISENMLEIAHSKASAAGIENITFEQTGIGAAEVPEAFYDAAMGMSILHLVEDKDAVLARVSRALKPGGVFFSSTICLGERRNIFQIVAPVGYFLRLLPLVKCFSAAELEQSIRAAEFEIEHTWQPGPDKPVFIVARKMS